MLQWNLSDHFFVVFLLSRYGAPPGTSFSIFKCSCIILLWSQHSPCYPTFSFARRNRRCSLLLLERLPVLLLVAGRLLCEPASYTLPPSPAKSGFYPLVFQGRTIGVVILSLDVTFPVARAILLCMYLRFGLV